MCIAWTWAAIVTVVFVAKWVSSIWTRDLFSRLFSFFISSMILIRILWNGFYSSLVTSCVNSNEETEKKVMGYNLFWCILTMVTTMWCTAVWPDKADRTYASHMFFSKNYSSNGNNNKNATEHSKGKENCEKKENNAVHLCSVISWEARNEINVVKGSHYDGLFYLCVRRCVSELNIEFAFVQKHFFSNFVVVCAVRMHIKCVEDQQQV